MKSRLVSTLRVTLALASVLSASAAAHAVALLSPDLVLSRDAEVFVTFDGYSAGYTSRLSLELPDDTFMALFTNKTTAVGTTIAAGTFAAGSELVFKLWVDNTSKAYFSGDASSNADGFAHAKIFAYDGASASLGFEDLWNGGDKDYNDFKFSVTARPVPDHAATGALLGIALTALVLARRRLG